MNAAARGFVRGDVGDDLGGARVHPVAVAAVVAGELVVLAAADGDEDVVARPAEQRVGTLPAVETIVPGPAGQRIVPGAAVENGVEVEIGINRDLVVAAGGVDADALIAAQERLAPPAGGGDEQASRIGTRDRNHIRRRRAGQAQLRSQGITAATTIVIGKLAEVERRIYFEYATDFLNRNLQLSPFKWPLRPGLIEHVDRAFGPLPGWIDDSLPDGWGLLLVDRMFRRRGLDPAAVSPLERLSYLGTRTMGALTYHPPAEVERDDQLIDLHEVGKNAQQIYSGEAVEVLPELMRAGGSPGGARPKVLIGLKGKQIISGENDLPDGFEHWIVKFAAKVDVRDAGPMEYAYAEMARTAGIDMPETTLFKAGKTQSYFGVRRFDRGPGATHPSATARSHRPACRHVMCACFPT